jgi:hypothetical protein
MATIVKVNYKKDSVPFLRGEIEELTQALNSAREELDRRQKLALENVAKIRLLALHYRVMRTEYLASAAQSKVGASKDSYWDTALGYHGALRLLADAFPDQVEHPGSMLAVWKEAQEKAEL